SSTSAITSRFVHIHISRGIHIFPPSWRSRCNCKKNSLAPTSAYLECT
uniref:Uncharacterized protein n=1 Tax=Aegilops tauschii subsp. strangulata TaxID=200361 RepID=A0A453GZA4_AEGTS